MNKKIIFLVVGVFGLAVIGIVFWIVRSRIIPKYNGPVETVRVSVSNAGVDLSTLIWIADSEGYFKDNGLNVELTREINGVIAQEKVATGAADIATDSDFGFVGDSFTLSNLRIIASIGQVMDIDVVSRKDSGINSPSDLKGKKIGVTRGLAPLYFLSQFLTVNNILLSQVTIINTPVADLQSAIVTGSVDAIAINDPTVYNVMTALGSNGIDWPAQDGQYFSWLLLTNYQFTKTNPDTIKRFLTSIVMAEKFTKENPDKSKQIMENKFSLDPKYFDQNWPKHNFIVSLDQSLIIVFQNEARWVIANKITNKTVIPNYSNFIYFDALTQADPDKVTVIH